MSASLILVVGRDAERRRAVIDSLSLLRGVQLRGIDGIDGARAEVAATGPAVVIAPWLEGSTTGLSLRAVAPRPYLLLLSERIDQRSIAVASAAGRVEIIPNRPLDLAALRNRVALLLWGPSAVARMAGSGQAATAPALDLSDRPALLRRLGAA